MLRYDFLSLCARIAVYFPKKGDNLNVHQANDNEHIAPPFLEDIITDLRVVETFNDEEQEQLLDFFQEVIDFPELDTTFRANVVDLLIWLSKKFQKHPECLSISSLQLLGKYPVFCCGNYGDVWKGCTRGENVAVKVVRLSKTADIEALLKEYYREAIIWSQLSHPNLLPFYGIYYLDSEKERICLVSPWMENGNLTSFLEVAPEDLDRRSLLLDIAQGLQYLHEKRIVHADLKGANILITSSHRACIADFGLSSISRSARLQASFAGQSKTTGGGTARWLAPEVHSTRENTKASDIYACACVAYEIFSGRLPFHETTQDITVVLHVRDGKRPPRPESFQLDDNLWAFVEECWDQDPDRRPDASSLVTRLQDMFGVVQPASPWDASIPRLLRSSLRQLTMYPTPEDLNKLLQGNTKEIDGSEDNLLWGRHLGRRLNRPGIEDTYTPSYFPYLPPTPPRGISPQQDVVQSSYYPQALPMLSNSPSSSGGEYEYRYHGNRVSGSPASDYSPSPGSNFLPSFSPYSSGGDYGYHSNESSGGGSPYHLPSLSFGEIPDINVLDLNHHSRDSPTRSASPYGSDAVNSRPIRKKFQCEYCGERSGTQAVLNRHLQRSCKKRPRRISGPPSPP